MSEEVDQIEGPRRTDWRTKGIFSQKGVEENQYLMNQSRGFWIGEKERCKKAFDGRVPFNSFICFD
jgi:hypothetical protein